MVKVMVMEIVKGKVEGRGSHTFAVLPRVGEHVGHDVDGVGRMFRVIDVHHAMDEAETVVGDVFVVDVGTIVDHVKNLEQQHARTGSLQAKKLSGL